MITGYTRRLNTPHSHVSAWGPAHWDPAHAARRQAHSQETCKIQYIYIYMYMYVHIILIY